MLTFFDCLAEIQTFKTQSFDIFRPWKQNVDLRNSVSTNLDIKKKPKMLTNYDLNKANCWENKKQKIKNSRWEWWLLVYQKRGEWWLSWRHIRTGRRAGVASDRWSGSCVRCTVPVRGCEPAPAWSTCRERCGSLPQSPPTGSSRRRAAAHTKCWSAAISDRLSNIKQTTR